MASYIYTNLPRNVIVRLLHPRSGGSQNQETFLAPSSDNQTFRPATLFKRQSNTGDLIGFEKRNILINSFIYANFNYCPLVWHFSSKKSIDKIENIQKRTSRSIKLKEQRSKKEH